MPHSLGKLIETLVLTLLCCSGVAQAKDYDVVILNGRVIDPETYLDAQMHVGITGGSGYRKTA